MSDIIWGPAIEVDGKRPDWLEGSTKIQWKKPDMADWRGICEARDHNWRSYVHTPNTETVAIRLPADHFAYKAIAKGLTPWGGGSEAPKDWDGEDILCRDGRTGSNSISWWTHDGGSAGGDPCNSDIIGYHPKPIAQPSPADTVTVGRITRNEADALIRRSDHDIFVVLSNFGIIRPDTKAEAIAAKTGVALPDVEAVLAAVEEGE